MERIIHLKRLSICAGFMAFHTLAGALMGSLFPPGDWVKQLVKPAFYPPPIAFPIAWTFLYGLMGISLWLFWSSAESRKRKGLFWYASQLSVNFLFTPLMFGLQSTLLGLIDILILLPILHITILAFYRSSPKAAYLLIPYSLWVFYALALALSLWLLNP